MNLEAFLPGDGRLAGGLRSVALVTAAMLACAALDPVIAQQRELAPAEAPVAQQPAPPDEFPPAHRPGLFDAIGDLLGKSTGIFSLKGAQDTIDDFNRKAGEATRDAAKAATDNLTRLPGTRLASGRTLCVVSANGAPDCAAAANALCKSKGFGAGSSIATESGEKCPARVYLSGKPPRPGECRTETFVTSAMCQ
jgi:hypothetical protein